MKLIIKLSPEITIKTRPVRKRFVQQLHTNIRRVLKRRGLSADVVWRWDMLEVNIPVTIGTDLPISERVLADTGQGEGSEGGQSAELAEREDGQATTCYTSRSTQVMEALQTVPGISYFIRVQERVLTATAQDQALEEIYQHTLAVVGEQLAGKTFLVRCKRQGDHCFNSHDVERYVGGGLNQHTDALGVQMRDADVSVNLEIKRRRLFIVEGRQQGLGGYPLGCVGPAISLMSGGYDSSVASFEMIRRGVETHFCFFNLGGHAHEVGVKQVSHFLWDRYASSHRTAFINIQFEAVVEEILTKISNPYMGVILKRMMIRAASAVAEKMKIDALVTGESISQVSSQTLKNLAVIDAVSDTLVIRPLATEDKSMIINKANHIGVAEYAEHMPEYCAVISDKPTTAAKMHIVEKEEQRFDFSILDAAIANMHMTGIDKIYQQELAFDDVEKLSIPEPEQIVIDLRHDDEREREPLVLHANQILNIPFYKINRLFNTLDPQQQYLLYCGRGVMSQLHAVHLHAEGFTNVKVYHPS